MKGCHTTGETGLLSLQALLHTTAQPVEQPTDAELRQAEAQLGLTLPEDYKSFIQHYGTGLVGGMLRILNPRSPYERTNLVAAANDGEFDFYTHFRSRYPDEHPYRRYPEAGGLLPWAKSIDGDILYWLAQGDHACWPVVVWSRGDHQLYLINSGMVGFLVDYVSKGMVRTLFGSTPAFRDDQYVVPVR